MAMNSIGWAPNWFGFEVSEMERQISNWCNLNANETFQVVFDIRDIKAFLKANKLHRFTNGKRYVLYTKKLIVTWNEVEDGWGLLYKVESNEDFNKVLYQAPKTPADASGIIYVKMEA